MEISSLKASIFRSVVAYENALTDSRAPPRINVNPSVSLNWRDRAQLGVAKPVTHPVNGVYEPPAGGLFQFPADV